MSKIEEKKHKELVTVLSELIEIIELMMQEEKDYLLVQNKNEAKDWLEFLKKHTDKDELKSLENEISDRFSISLMCKLEHQNLIIKERSLSKSIY